MNNKITRTVYIIMFILILINVGIYIYSNADISLKFKNNYFNVGNEKIEIKTVFNYSKLNKKNGKLDITLKNLDENKIYYMISALNINADGVKESDIEYIVEDDYLKIIVEQDNNIIFLQRIYFEDFKKALEFEIGNEDDFINNLAN